MCGGSPDIPAAQKLQEAQAPVYRDTEGTKSKGRRGTILTGSSSAQDLTVSGGKKTQLGQ